MINWESFAKTAAVIGGYFAMRVVAGWRVDKRKQVEMRTALIDPILIETTFAPRPGDDADLLAEVRDTLTHLNRQAYAEEFWNVSDQIVALDAKLPPAARSTLRSALARMMETDERWLRIVGAKSSGALGITEASMRLRALIDQTDGEDAIDVRMRIVLKDALEALELSPAPASPSVGGAARLA